MRCTQDLEPLGWMHSIRPLPSEWRSPDRVRPECLAAFTKAGESLLPAVKAAPTFFLYHLLYHSFADEGGCQKTLPNVVAYINQSKSIS